MVALHEARIVRAFSAFRNSNIEPILIKGWAAAQNYPDHSPRAIGDIDLVVSPDEYSRGLALARSAELVDCFIDLHCGFRQLDVLAWSDLLEHSVVAELRGTAIRTLCREDHLRVMCDHWLVDGGRFKNKLLDIYYAVANRPDDFDWDRCLNVVPDHRRKWVVCAIAVARRYLDLDVRSLPFANETEQIPGWITEWIEWEWEQPDTLEPVLTSWYDKRLMLRQIRRRFPPNPIRSTIECDGDLYGRRQWMYQSRVLLRRIPVFLTDALNALKLRVRGNIS